MHPDSFLTRVLSHPLISGRNMTRCIYGIAAGMALSAAPASGLNLLVNGTLDSPGVHESDLADGWTLVEPDVDSAGAAVNSATFATFGDHTGAGGVGLWYRSFVGGLNAGSPATVNAHLYQDVPGTPGDAYTLSAWYRYEAHYPGTDPFAVTDTFLALEFLDAGAGTIGSAQQNADDSYPGTDAWFQVSLNGVAPAGTAFVRVRSSMVDGVFADANPQSAFVDDFILVPEPNAAMMLFAVGAALLRCRASRSRGLRNTY